VLSVRSEISLDFCPSNGVTLAASEVRLRKFMSLFLLYLRVDPNKSVALHFLITHDETSKQIVIYNDDYTFVVFSYGILH